MSSVGPRQADLPGSRRTSVGLAITPDHRSLESVVREWAVDQAVRAATRVALTEPAAAVASPDQLWKQVVDLGWPSSQSPRPTGAAGAAYPEPGSSPTTLGARGTAA